MKRIYLLAVGLAATLGIGLLSARTWTSADGTKKFEGDLRAYDKKTGKWKEKNFFRSIGESGRWPLQYYLISTYGM